jgi:hypothetical protein
MVVQVDLHAADIDEPDAAGLQFADGGNCFRPRREEPACTLRVDRPGPGRDRAGSGIPAPGFDEPDGHKQAGRQALGSFRRSDGGPTRVALARCSACLGDGRVRKKQRQRHAECS